MFWRRKRSQRDFAEELQAHLALEADRLREAGMSEAEALAAARRNLGNVAQAQERFYEAHRWLWLDSVIQDLRFGLRQLRRNPGFTAVAVITLALGIGANTAIFSVIDAVLIRPLPFRNPGRLVQLWETEAAPGQFPLAGSDYLEWQAHNRTLQASSLYTQQQSYNASGVGEPEEVAVVATQANFFSTLGVEPVLGRTFVRGEDSAGHDRVALLSFGFWQQHFGGRRDALGRTVELNLRKYTVVGVMPAWFQAMGVGTADIWTPLDTTPGVLSQNGSHLYQAIGRLKPGVTVAQAQADLGTIAKRLELQDPQSNRGVGAAVIPLKEQLVGNSRVGMLIMMAAVALVLLIACVNVAGLLLARAETRRGEIAVRHALGAPAHRIVRQLLTESVLLWLIGGAIGLALAWAGIHALSAADTALLPQPNPISLDSTVLLFTAGVSAVAGVLFGFVPAWKASRPQLNEELKLGAQAAITTPGKRRRAGEALVVAEVTISLLLLVGAGLLLRSFVRLREIHVGVQSKGVLTAQLSLPAQRYTTAGQTGGFYQELLDRLSSAPGVQAASVSTELPLQSGVNGYVTVPGHTNHALDKVLVEWDSISQNYFRVWGIPFLRGRNFNGQDLRDATETLRRIDAMMKSGKVQPLGSVGLSAVINETMAKTFWPREGALGRTFELNGVVPVRVVGIVSDVKEYVHAPVGPQAYYPLAVAFHAPGSPMYVSLKTTAGLSAGLAALRDQVHALDPALALFRVRTIREIISEAMGDTSYQTLLLGLFALLALILTAVGIYGVISYAVRQRTHEIAVRIALGAQRQDVLRLVVGQGMIRVLAGIGIGIAAALALTRFLSSLLYGVKPTDPVTLALVALVLGAVALIACYVPARRAANVDPMVALRHE